MPKFSPQEKRTIRLAVAVLVLFFLLMGGAKVSKFLQARRAEYKKVVSETRSMADALKPYKYKAQDVAALMEKFQMDPSRLNRSTVVADASAAIQKAAMSGGIQLGPIRESPARSAARELSLIQMDGMGQVQAIMTFLSRFDSLGYPLLVDSVQITADPRNPQMIKLHLSIVIMDFDAWKVEQRPNA